MTRDGHGLLAVLAAFAFVSCVLRALLFRVGSWDSVLSRKRHNHTQASQSNVACRNLLHVSRKRHNHTLPVATARRSSGYIAQLLRHVVYVETKSLVNKEYGQPYKLHI